MPCTSDKDLEDSTAHLGFAGPLWLAADKLRNNVDPADDKHVVLGLIFLHTPQDYFMPSLAGLQNSGKCAVSRPFHPLIPDAVVGRHEVTHPAGRRFTKRSFHDLLHTLVSDHPDSRSTPGIGRKRTGYKTASVHDLYAHFERETLRAAVHAIPFPPEL